ncbi:MAG: TonB-dependent receptor [Pseudomonadota bacterium]
MAVAQPEASASPDAASGNEVGGNQKTSAPEPYDLGEIVVTAQKVPRRQFETNASISVLRGADLEVLGISDARDAFRLVPNASFAPTNRGNNGFTLRGINSEGVTGPANVTRPLASLVLDGITQSFEGARRGPRGTYDVEQIEVARGPQSTLLGRNALAGALLINTRRPSFAWEGSARLAVGTLGFREQAAMLSGPLGDPVTAEHAFRVVAQRFESDKGYDIQTPDLDTEIDEDRYESVRLKWLYEPRERPFTVLLTASTVSDRPAQAGVQGPNFFERRITVPLASYEFRENEVDNVIADVAVEVGQDWSLRSLTGFTHTDARIEAPAASQLLREEARVDDDFSQELRLERIDGGNDIVLGFYGASLSNQRDSLIAIRPTSFRIQDLTSETQLDNLAVFGEVRRPIGQQFELTAGLRYEYEDYQVDQLDRNQDTPERSRIATDYDSWLPKLGLAWEPTDRQRLAFTVSRGYRGGYVETRATTGEQNAIEPEFLTAYEIAWRAELADRRLFLSANFYQYDWKDQQVSLVDPLDPLGILTITSNAAASTSRGMEFELRWQLADDLRLLAGVGLLRTEFDEFQSPSGDFSGFEFPEAPRENATITLLWSPPSGWFASADASYTGSYFSTGRVADRDDPAFDPFLIPGFTVVNVGGGYRGSGWELRGYVRNLADRDYLLGRSFDGNEGFVGDELAYGVELDLSF